MSTWRDRRAADRRLCRIAWSIARDRKQSRSTRRAARKVWAVFALRVALGWHAKPTKALEALVGSFRHGEYCGVGHGLPDGESADPVDALDAACQDHDQAYG